MPLKLVFMGTPEFAVPCLDALVGGGARDRRRLFAAAASGRARHGGSQVSGSCSGGGAGASRVDAEELEGGGRAGGVCRARGGCRGRRCLWALAAARRSRCAESWLLQRACVCAAALAWRRSHPSGDHGGRCRDSRDGHEDGRRTRYGSRCLRRSAFRSAR